MAELKKTPAAPKSVYVLKMTPELAKRLNNKHVAYVRLPRPFVPGTRVLLREYHGALTGRADLCEVIAHNDNGMSCLRRTWCWSQNAPDDLSALSYLMSDEVFPVRLEAEAD